MALGKLHVVTPVDAALCAVHEHQSEIGRIEELPVVKIENIPASNHPNQLAVLDDWQLGQVARGKPLQACFDRVLGVDRVRVLRHRIIGGGHVTQRVIPDDALDLVEMNDAKQISLAGRPRIDNRQPNRGPDRP